MFDIIKLATAYLRSQWKLSTTLVVIVALSLALPLTTSYVTSAYQSELEARSQNPSLLVGARGDRFDLVLRAQFYVGELQQAMTHGDYEKVNLHDGLITAPLHLSHTASRGAWAVIGTSSAFLTAKGLEIASGTTFAEMGTCVVGAEVAKRLEGKSTVRTDMKSLFGIGDMMPYDLEVVGTLEPTGTADDSVVLISLETAWLLDGYGHIHEDNDIGSAVDRNSRLHGVEGAHIPSQTETKLTAENRHRVHFHGEQSQYRISAVAVWPQDDESNALFQAAYLDDRALQVVVPEQEFQKLMDYVFQVKEILDLVFIILMVISAVMVVTSIVQSIQLRKQHLETMQYLGCSAIKVKLLLATELVVLGVFALVLSAVMVAVMVVASPSLMTLV